MSRNDAILAYLAEHEQRVWMIEEEEAEIARLKAEAEAVTPVEPKRKTLGVKKADAA